jgi:ferredoxin
MRMPVVDENLCIGCGHCVELCPQVFELEDEKSRVVGPEKCGSCNCQEAIDTCPVLAISRSE